MAISIPQKLDYILKKLGYSSSKTGLAEDEGGINGTRKAPFAEPIPSPLIVSNTGLWFESQRIPTLPPSTDYYIIPGEGYPSYKLIEIYGTTNAFRMTEDNTVSGRRTFIAREIYVIILPPMLLIGLILNLDLDTLLKYMLEIPIPVDLN